ncbi:DMA2 E3 ubiquitin-protein ligase DMA2 [Candida maltosa Xu316]
MPENSSKTISRESVPPTQRTISSKGSNCTPPLNNLNSPGSSRPSSPLEPPVPPSQQHQQTSRRPSFGLNFLSNFGMRSHANESSSSATSQPLMSNSPTLGNIHPYVNDEIVNGSNQSFHETTEVSPEDEEEEEEEQEEHQDIPAVHDSTLIEEENKTGLDKDGFYSVRLTPLIDHSSSSSGLYFSPIIRRLPPKSSINIGRYTEKNKAAAHAPQGSSAPIVFKSKVVSRTHALFFCNEDGQWFLRDTKSSSGTFLNHIRLSPASQESSLMPIIDGDIIQLGMDYRGGTEEVYRSVKMRCHFNNSWQRKMNPYNIEMFKKLQIGDKQASECSICLNTIQPGHPMFIGTCGHWWHYRCIHPLLQKSYPSFSCPNCRYVCDLEYFSESE